MGGLIILADLGQGLLHGGGGEDDDLHRLGGGRFLFRGGFRGHVVHGDFLRGSFRRGFGFSRGGGLFGSGRGRTAGTQSQQHGQSQEQCGDLFHGNYSFLKCIFCNDLRCNDR